MFFQILRSLLGPFVVILDFLILNPEVLGLICLLYLGVLGLGKWQVKRIKEQTDQLLIVQGKIWLAENPKLTLKQIFDRFYPLWLEELRNYRFPLIMSKHDLWPVSVSPGNVLKKIPVSPEYVGEVLKSSGLLNQSKQEKPVIKKTKK